MKKRILILCLTLCMGLASPIMTHAQESKTTTQLTLWDLEKDNPNLSNEEQEYRKNFPISRVPRWFSTDSSTTTFGIRDGYGSATTYVTCFSNMHHIQNFLYIEQYKQGTWNTYASNSKYLADVSALSSSFSCALTKGYSYRSKSRSYVARYSVGVPEIVDSYGPTKSY